MLEINVNESTSNDDTLKKRNIVVEEFLIPKIVIAEDDKIEIPVITFKSRTGTFSRQPYFSVFRGETEIHSIPLEVENIELKYDTQ